MTVVALIGLGIIVLLAAVAMGKHFRVQELEAECRTLIVQAQEAEAWCEHWAHQAEQAAEEAEAVCKAHATLQRMYTRISREQLAANWPIIQYYAAMKRRSSAE